VSGAQDTESTTAGESSGDRGSDVVHAAARGAVAAMAMTGMRTFTVDVGLVKQSPPQAIARQRARGLMQRVPRGRRRAAVELMHWTYGGVGGAAFGLLPAGLRRQVWSGPAFGLASWFGFELGLAPILGLKQARSLRLVERVALAVDHLLYGMVVGETRRRPRS
jgi:hypothetical protein